MLSRQSVLIAIVLGLLSTIVITEFVRPARSRRFQLVVLDKDNLDYMLLDTQEGRVWASKQLPLPKKPFGWMEMVRLDTPASLYSTEQNAWARRKASEIDAASERWEQKTNLTSKLDELIAKKTAIEDRLEELRQAAIEEAYHNVKKSEVSVNTKQPEVSVSAEGIPVDAEGAAILPDDIFEISRETLESTITEPPANNPEVIALRGKLSAVETEIASVKRDLSYLDIN